MPFDRRLIITEAFAGQPQIQSQGAIFQESADPATKQQKLSEYQEEMRSFSTFLKDKHFGSAPSALSTPASTT